MYWEFFAGEWVYGRDEFWNEGSICIDWEPYFEIEGIIWDVIPEYNSFGETQINRMQWEEICRKAIQKSEVAAQIVQEADLWATEVWKNHNVFTILGI